MSQCVEGIVHAKLESFVRILDWIEGVVIGPLPKIAYVVVIIDDHHCPAVFVLDAEKLRLPPIIRLLDGQRFYREKAVEDRMCYIQLFHLELRQGPPDV